MISVAAPGLCHCGSADILVTRTSPFSSPATGGADWDDRHASCDGQIRDAHSGRNGV